MFSTKLKELRTLKGITQEELANKLGVRQQTIGKWEASITVPRLPMLQKIGAFFNVSVDYLLGRTDEPQGTGFQKGDGGKEGNTVGETDDAAGGSTILMRAQSELDEDELKQLENMAEFFLKKKLNN